MRRKHMYVVKGPRDRPFSCSISFCPNEENSTSIFDDGVPNERLTQGISRNEVKVAISRMKNGKATGMDGIPVEVWKCLGEEGIDMLWDLMQGILIG